MRYRLTGSAEDECVDVTEAGTNFAMVCNGRSFSCQLLAEGPPARYLVIEDNDATSGRVVTVHSLEKGMNAEGCDIEWVTEQSMSGIASNAPQTAGAGDVCAPMPGRIVRVTVSVGDSVDLGTPLLAMEAMKMENELFAPVAGTVTAVEVTTGDAVEPGQALIKIEAKAEA